MIAARQIFRAVGLDGLTALIFLVCVGGAMALWTPTGLGSSRAAYYETYADSIKHGHLWLEDLSDKPACSWDMSEHDGKCYAYWGILPALVHVVLPLVHDRLLTLLALTGTVYFFSRLMLRLSPVPPQRAAATVATLLCLVGAGLLPATAAGARIYEEAISVGLVFGLAGLYFATVGFKEMQLPNGNLPARLWLALLLLALGGMARTTWLASAALALAFWFLIHLQRFGRPTFMRVIGASAPLAVAVTICLALNYVRFGDPLDFGWAKQSANQAMLAAGVSPSSIKHVPPNIAMYLVGAIPPPQNPLTATEWPPISESFAVTRWLAKGRPYYENPLAALLGAPLLFWGLWRLSRPNPERRFAWMITLFSIPSWLGVLSLAGTVSRYEFEALLPLLFLAGPEALGIAADVTAGRRLVLWILVVLGLAASCLEAVWIVRTLCEWWHFC